ncbi:MAG: hypothetical protein FVQ83_10080 [Chloroflexi bacterium]|nr:hypothetical protein [Chloroflexota bacterium]
MNVNIACSAPGCTNSVIGQCTGYDANCGRYYCREHSLDTLCYECANKNQVQIVYQDYLDTAEGLEIEARKAIDTKAIFKKGARISAIIGLVTGPIFASFIGRMEGGFGYAQLFCIGLIGGPLYLMWFYATLIGPIIWVICGIKRGRWHKKIGLYIANDIEESKPGFLEFYKTWRKEKSKEKLTNALAVAGVIAAIGIAAALSESEYDRTRRAVRDELNSQ